MASILIPFLLVAGAAPAHADPAAALVQAERQWMEAMRLRNGPALRRFVAPDFTLSGLGDLSRPPVPAATWLDNALRHLRTEAFRFDGMKAQVSGDTGIVRAGYRWSGAFDGEHFDDRGALVDIWVRRQGRWTVVSRVIADPPPAKP
jgi:ketosteroid isomerase-like protein